jgi:hypothetical protein
VAKFANACIEQVKELTKELEISLGPDTADIVSISGVESFCEIVTPSSYTMHFPFSCLPSLSVLVYIVDR